MGSFEFLVKLAQPELRGAESGPKEVQFPKEGEAAVVAIGPVGGGCRQGEKAGGKVSLGCTRTSLGSI